MITEACGLARASLSLEVPQRWSHTEARAKEAERITPAYGGDGMMLVAAAWLLDIGHAPFLTLTGFPPLDAANHLRAQGWLPRVVNLVANRTGASFEASARGLRDTYAGFHDERSAIRDALWYCDVATGPNGTVADPDQRIAEATGQYGSGDLAGGLATTARDEIGAAVRRTRQLLKGQRLL